TKAWSGLPLDPDVATAVASTAALLEQLGHAVVEDTPRFDYDAFLAAQIDLWAGHTAAFIDAIGQAVGRVPSEQNLQTTSWATYVARPCQRRTSSRPKSTTTWSPARSLSSSAPMTSC